MGTMVQGTAGGVDAGAAAPTLVRDLLAVTPDPADDAAVPDARHAVPATYEQEREWYQSLAFEGALDPAGTPFAFALAVAATVGLVVLVAAAVRILNGS